jgi:hypothetical protein
MVAKAWGPTRPMGCKEPMFGINYVNIQSYLGLYRHIWLPSSNQPWLVGCRHDASG